MQPLYVIKKDGRREKFDRNKIKNGILKAIEKRPVKYEQVEEILDKIEEKIRRNGSEEINTKDIGEYVMDLLKEVDHVAYIRFASVYRDFKNSNDFKRELKDL